MTRPKDTNSVDFIFIQFSHHYHTSGKGQNQHTNNTSALLESTMVRHLKTNIQRTELIWAVLCQLIYDSIVDANIVNCYKANNLKIIDKTDFHY